MWDAPYKRHLQRSVHGLELAARNSPHCTYQNTARVNLPTPSVTKTNVSSESVSVSMTIDRRHENRPVHGPGLELYTN